MAQLGARFHGMEEVKGSNPFRSTKLFSFPKKNFSARTVFCFSVTERNDERKEANSFSFHGRLAIVEITSTLQDRVLGRRGPRRAGFQQKSEIRISDFCCSEERRYAFRRSAIFTAYSTSNFSGIQIIVAAGIASTYLRILSIQLCY